jgi:hypothetical protein
MPFWDQPNMSTDRSFGSVAQRRSHELNTIAALLWLDRREELAELLTDQNAEALRHLHLVNEGMGHNTLRAPMSNLAYLQTWSLAATGTSSLASA